MGSKILIQYRRKGLIFYLFLYNLFICIYSKKMKLFSVVALAVGLINAQDIDPEFLLEGLGLDAAEILASDPEVDALLAAYEADNSADDAAADEGFERSMFGGASMFGNRNLPPGINLMDFLTPQGTFDTFAFLNALKAALEPPKAVKDVTTTAAPTTTTLFVPAAYEYAYDSNYDYYQEYASELEANANAVGNRPGASDTQEKTFLSTSGVAFTSCRICNDVSPLACSNVAPTPCVNTQTDDASDMLCRVTLTTRYDSSQTDPLTATNILMRSECVTPQACEDSVRQNFLGPKTMNQCKPFDGLNRRFRTSTCKMCHKMTDDTDINKFFTTDDNIIIAMTNAETSTPLNFVELVNNPIDYMTSTALEPHGGLEATYSSYNVA